MSDDKDEKFREFFVGLNRGVRSGKDAGFREAIRCVEELARVEAFTGPRKSKRGKLRIQTLLEVAELMREADRVVTAKRIDGGKSETGH